MSEIMNPLLNFMNKDMDTFLVGHHGMYWFTYNISCNIYVFIIYVIHNEGGVSFTAPPTVALRIHVYNICYTLWSSHIIHCPDNATLRIHVCIIYQIMQEACHSLPSYCNTAKRCTSLKQKLRGPATLTRMLRLWQLCWLALLFRASQGDDDFIVVVIMVLLSILIVFSRCTTNVL